MIAWATIAYVLFAFAVIGGWLAIALAVFCDHGVNARNLAAKRERKRRAAFERGGLRGRV